MAKAALMFELASRTVVTLLVAGAPSAVAIDCEPVEKATVAPPICASALVAVAPLTGADAVDWTAVTRKPPPTLVLASSAPRTKHTRCC